jgi:hypothetical protein
MHPRQLVVMGARNVLLQSAAELSYEVRCAAVSFGFAEALRVEVPR